VSGGLSLNLRQNLSMLEIGYEVPEAGHLEILLYDGSGRLVANLADRSITSGAHSLEVPVGHLPQGRYVISSRLDGKQLASRSLVLVR